MTILVSAARGRTGNHIIEALRRLDDAPAVRGLVRSDCSRSDAGFVVADLDNRNEVEAALVGVDTIIHYGPTMQANETSIGISMIDACQEAGVRKFVYISVIHPHIEHLVNHKAKLAVESHLFNSSLDWTVLRPQHYMQNTDIARILEQNAIYVPYSVDTMLGHVDMRDLADAAALVATTAGHTFASYDIDGGQRFSTRQLAEQISEITGREIAAHEVSVGDAITAITHRDLGDVPLYMSEGFQRLFGYYSRVGIAGNPHVARWLLEREPGTFRDYVLRSLT